MAGEIVSGLWAAFAPFVGKAIIAIIVVSLLGLGINLATHAIRNRKKKSDQNENIKNST